MAIPNKSILVVEDIDCTIQFQDRRAESMDGLSGTEVTLSGLLNFIDGWWSSCGEERIIVFTTNRKDKLDPALLRPGRMDVHIHMSFCTPCVFRQLAFNYVGLRHHPLFPRIEDAIVDSHVTPAQVAELLLESSDHHSQLEGLVHFLEAKRQEAKLQSLGEEEQLPTDDFEVRVWRNFTPSRRGGKVRFN